MQLCVANAIAVETPPTTIAETTAPSVNKTKHREKSTATKFRTVLAAAVAVDVVDDARSFHFFAAHLALLENRAGTAIVLVEAVGAAGGGAAVSAAKAAVDIAAGAARPVRGTDSDQTVAALRF